MEKILIEKQVWESTLKASMDRAGRIQELEDMLNECELKLGARDIEHQVLSNIIDEFENENARLKELLKKARDLIEQINWCESFYAYNDGLDEEIDKVLGDKTDESK